MNGPISQEERERISRVWGQFSDSKLVADQNEQIEDLLFIHDHISNLWNICSAQFGPQDCTSCKMSMVISRIQITIQANKGEYKFSPPIKEVSLDNLLYAITAYGSFFPDDTGMYAIARALENSSKT